MKNLKYLLVALVLIASTACDNYFFDNKLEHKTVVTEVRNFAYTLVDADYETIAKSDAAKAIAAKLDAEAGAESTEYANALAQVGNKKKFYQNASAKLYVTFALSAKYPDLDEGSICNVTYKMDGVSEPVTSICALKKGTWVLDIYFQEPFNNSKGAFTVVNVTEFDGVWSTGAGMTANGYNIGVNDCWLISSAIAVPADAEKPVLVFDQMMQYDNGNFLTQCQLYISEGYAGATPNIEEEGWKLITIPVAGSSFGSSGELDLSEYKGKSIYIGFHYTCGDNAIAWTVKNVTIREAE